MRPVSPPMMRKMTPTGLFTHPGQGWSRSRFTTTHVRAAVLLGPDVEAKPRGWAHSQSPDDARRDGVPATIAAAPLELRGDVFWRASTPEGEWQIAGTSDWSWLIGHDGCRIPGTDWCTLEYGEIRLVRDGMLVRAYPMPVVPPEWLFATDRYLYAGRHGDGALGNGALVRIDREKLEMTAVALVYTDVIDPYDDWTLPAGRWFKVHVPMADYEGLVRYEPFAGGVRTGSESQIWVDVAGVDAFIDEMVGG